MEDKFKEAVLDFITKMEDVFEQKVQAAERDVTFAMAEVRYFNDLRQIIHLLEESEHLEMWEVNGVLPEDQLAMEA